VIFQKEKNRYSRIILSENYKKNVKKLSQPDSFEIHRQFLNFSGWGEERNLIFSKEF
jgi:hypothetical protein